MEEIPLVFPAFRAGMGNSFPVVVEDLDWFVAPIMDLRCLRVFLWTGLVENRQDFIRIFEINLV